MLVAPCNKLVERRAEHLDNDASLLENMLNSEKGEESESSSNKDASDTRADFIFGAVKDVHWLVLSQLSFSPADDKDCMPPYKPFNLTDDPTKNTESLLPFGNPEQLASDGTMLRYTDWSSFACHPPATLPMSIT